MGMSTCYSVSLEIFLGPVVRADRNWASTEWVEMGNKDETLYFSMNHFISC